MILTLLTGAVGTLGFMIIVNAPRRSLIPAGLLGGAGYALYLLLQQLGCGEPSSMFLGCLAACLLAQLAARRLHMIATIFITAAIIPCVPGLGLYRTMSLLAQGQNAAAMNTGTAAMIDVLMIALAIAVSAWAARVFPRSRRTAPRC